MSYSCYTWSWITLESQFGFSNNSFIQLLNKGGEADGRLQGKYKNSKMQKCSYWEYGGSLCLQIQEPSQKALVYPCQNSSVGCVRPTSSPGTLCFGACSEQHSPRVQHLPKTHFKPHIRPLMLPFLLQLKLQ